MSRTERATRSWGAGLLLFGFFSLFYLTPYGFSIGSEVVWLTDIVSIFIIGIILLYLLVCRVYIVINGYRASLALFLLLLFFVFEFSLPLVGVAVWGDLSSASSSLRALLYWLPFIFLFAVFNPSHSFDLKKLDKLFFIAVSLNFLLGFVELAIYFGVLPEFLNFRLYIADFAPQERFLRNRMMSFGFFQNSTAYGVFGFLALVHCLSRLLVLDANKSKYLLFAFLSFVIIVLSTSRIPLAAAFISFGFYLIFLRRTQWNILLTFFLICLGAAALVSLFTVDLTLFSRFTRLVEGGLEGDYSLNKRMAVYWPNALAYYFDLGHPTFTNPTKYVGTIDSGYLTYLLQGGWLLLLLTVVIPPYS